MQMIFPYLKQVTGNVLYVILTFGLMLLCIFVTSAITVHLRFLLVLKSFLIRGVFLKFRLFIKGRCIICGAPGISDAYYCRECTLQEKDVIIL